MKDFLLSLVKSIVDVPDEVTVTENGPELVLKVAPSDMGKVIGKGGRIIKAIRDLVRVLAIKSGARVNVILTEE
jgi:uncharacterized protein